MICWVKSFGILYFLLRIGDPAEGCGQHKRPHARQDKFTTGQRGIANVLPRANRRQAWRLPACSAHAWLAKTMATGTIESEEQPR
jgi:hypothetical protein